MTAEQYKKAVDGVIYLASCAVRAELPDVSAVADMDLDCLYEAAAAHSLTAVTSYSLQKAGVKDQRFLQDYGRAVRKAAIMESELRKLSGEMDRSGIWFLPLKGAVIKDLYPAVGLRQMADFDILYDSSRRADVREIMSGLGFSLAHAGIVHDSYHKLPVCNFEMHQQLFAERPHRAIFTYYKDIAKRMLCGEEGTMRRHLSDDDFYIYILAHEYKHYSGSGTGLRSLLDIYVYNREKGGKLDRAYIRKELAAMGIDGFEKWNRRLAEALFSRTDVADEDRDALEYIYRSGTYGNVKNRVRNRLDDYGTGLFGKFRYALSRIFLPLSTVKYAFPAFYRIPVLLPFLPLYRFARGCLSRRRALTAELKTFFTYRSGKKNR